MNVADNIVSYLKYKGISVNKFSTEIGVSNSYFSKQIKENGSIGSKIMQEIVKKYEDINPEWLLTGKGAMLKTDTEIIHPKTEVTSEIRLIPFYDGVMTASIVTQELPSQTEPVEMVNAGDWFRDATVAMRVHGDSMYPDYVSGSIIGMKEVFNKRLIIYGQDYMIETSEYRVIKRLQKSHNPECWLMCSTNTEIWEVGAQKGKLIHEPQDIYIDDVLRVYQILGSVKRNHSSRVVSII
jgi:Peptidase S24-like